jgi:hypothetical protein
MILHLEHGGRPMCKMILAMIAIVLSGPAWSAESATPVSHPEPTEQQVLDQFRDDLQARSADVMAKGLTLTSEQAAKFWPLFDAYQRCIDRLVGSSALSARHRCVIGSVVRRLHIRSDWKRSAAAPGDRDRVQSTTLEWKRDKVRHVLANRNAGT